MSKASEKRMRREKGTNKEEKKGERRGDREKGKMIAQFSGEK